MNVVCISGYIAHDFETKQVGDSSVTEITVAVNEKVGKKQETYWARCVGWGFISNYIANYLHKGSLVELKGRLQQSSFTDKEGNKQTSTRIIIEKMQAFKSDNQQQQTPAQNSNGKKYTKDLPPQKPADVPVEDEDDDDIPF